mmetsp:Transcript_1813/g.2627  ORF Transcript_1813/g.2627 Transcript_1813/m.2627 type:complete len:192 (+) Transcript_1813:97-672(+)
MAGTSGLPNSSSLGNLPHLKSNGSRKRCADLCFELLFNECISSFQQRQPGPHAMASLEAIGFRVGRLMAERLSKDRPRFVDVLETVKFICKEFWQYLYGKQIDNLRTNRRGVFVLQDNAFKYLKRLAPVSTIPLDPASEEIMRQIAITRLAIPCGIIKGALCHLGVPCVSVDAEVKAPPSCSFTIKVTTSS